MGLVLFVEWGRRPVRKADEGWAKNDRLRLRISGVTAPMPEEKNEPKYDVFITWSGNRSKHVAMALRALLATVIQAAKPFMSKADIDKGSRWHLELAKALEATKVGIICLTPENPSAPWLLFESGALSKTMDRGSLRASMHQSFLFTWSRSSSLFF